MKSSMKRKDIEMQRLFFTGFPLFFLMAVSFRAEAQCAVNDDCRGERICVEGRCQYPDDAGAKPPASEEDAAAAPAVAPVVAPGHAPAPVAPGHGVPGHGVPGHAPAYGAPAHAAIATPTPTPTGAAEPPVDKAKGGVVSAAVVDLTGFALFLVGGAIAGIDISLLGVGLTMTYIGSGLLTAGSVVGTTSMTVRHSAFAKAGFNPPGGRRTGAWVMTGLTVVTYGGGIGLGVAAGAGMNFGLAMASIGVNGLAAILEVINMLAIRPKWDLQLKESAGVAVTAVPAITVARDDDTGRAYPVFVVAGAF